MSKACVIKGDEECEVDVVEVIAVRNNIESKMAMHDSTADGDVETFPKLHLETWAVVFESQHETQERKSGGESNIEANVNNNVEGKMFMDESMVIDGAELLPTVVPKTSAMEGGGEEMRVKANVYRGTVADKEAKNKATIEFGEEPEGGKKGRTRIQSGWNMTRLLFRPERESINLVRSK